MPLRPYDGGSLSMPAGAGRRFNKYGIDRTGDAEYAFNALGFRGEDYDPEATRHVFAFGCSNTYGVGISLEQSWTAVFRRFYAEHHQLRPADVNLLNFASVGASNRYISRTLITQCEEIRPDVVLVGFTYQNRMEKVIQERGFNIVPGVLTSANLATFSTDQRDEGLFRDLREVARHYYSFYTDEFGEMELLMNVLLVQHYCEQRNLEHVGLAFQALPESGLAAPLASIVDRDRLRTVETEWIVDRRVGHPGPESSRRIGGEAFDVYLRNAGSATGNGRA